MASIIEVNVGKYFIDGAVSITYCISRVPCRYFRTWSSLSRSETVGLITRVVENKNIRADFLMQDTIIWSCNCEIETWRRNLEVLDRLVVSSDCHSLFQLFLLRYRQEIYPLKERSCLLHRAAISFQGT